MNKQQAENQIRNALSNLTPPNKHSYRHLNLKYGNVYEAYIFVEVSKRIAQNHPSISLRLENPIPGQLKLKSSPGLVDRQNYSFIKIMKHNSEEANIFTDIEFKSLGYSQVSNKQRPLENGDYHESDILIVDAAVKNKKRPRPGEVWLSTECKNRSFKKQFLRETMGVRRCLSWHTGTNHTAKLDRWPVPNGQYKQDPVIPVLLYSPQNMNDYKNAAEDFDIYLKSCQMP